MVEIINKQSIFRYLRYLVTCKVKNNCWIIGVDTVE